MMLFKSPSKEISHLEYELSPTIISLDDFGVDDKMSVKSCKELLLAPVGG